MTHWPRIGTFDLAHHGDTLHSYSLDSRLNKEEETKVL